MADVAEHHRCAFEHYGDRCPLPGSSCDSTHPGPSTHWFCRYHNTPDKRRHGATALDAIRRGDLTIPEVNWREQVMADFQKAHPEFAIVPRNEAERQDILSMARAFADPERKFESDAERHERLRKELDVLRGMDRTRQESAA